MSRFTAWTNGLEGCALTANLIGEAGYVGCPVIEGLDEFAKIANSHIHLYGKIHAALAGRWDTLLWLGMTTMN